MVDHSLALLMTIQQKACVTVSTAIVKLEKEKCNANKQKQKEYKTQNY